jgi:hypothetical protein
VEDGMALDTVDMTLWLLIAAGAGFIWFGCHMTAAGDKAKKLHRRRNHHQVAQE